MNTMNTYVSGSVISAILFWLITISSTFIALITFSIIVSITFIIWVWQRLSSKKHPIYAMYNLHKGREITKSETLKNKFPAPGEGVKSAWTDVPNMGLEKNEIWSCHSLFVSCEDQHPEDKRPYIVLIHGTGSCSLVWGDIWKELSLKFRIIAIDLPGFGQSPTPTSLVNASAIQAQEFLVEFLKDWFNTVGITDKAILLGHSYGSFICIHFAKCYPEKVSRVILFDTAGILPTLGNSGAYWAVFFNLSPIQSCIRFLGPIGVWVAYTWFLQLNADEEVYYWFQLLAEPTAIGDLLVARNITVNWLTGEAFWNNPALKELTQIKSPISLVYGDCDTISPPHQGHLLAGLLGPKITCMELADTGHSITGGSSKNLIKIIEAAYASAGEIDQVARAFGANIPNDEFLSYRSFWSKKDTIQIIDNLYSWLEKLRKDIM